MRLRLLASVLLLLSAAAGLEAQIPEGMEGSFRPHPEAEEAISRLYSPFCPGFMLGVCTSREAAVLRDSMQTLAYQGWTADELVEWMVSQYGERYRAVPEASGWGIWAWILPPAALLIGATMVLVALRRFDPSRTAARASESPESVPARAERTISREEEVRLRSAIREIELSEDPSF